MSVKKKMTLLIFDLEREWMGVRFTVYTFPLLVSGEVDVGKRCNDFNIQLSMSICRIRFDPFLIYRFKCIEY